MIFGNNFLTSIYLSQPVHVYVIHICWQPCVLHSRYCRRYEPWHQKQIYCVASGREKLRKVKDVTGRNVESTKIHYITEGRKHQATIEGRSKPSEMI